MIVTAADIHSAPEATPDVVPRTAAQRLKGMGATSADDGPEKIKIGNQDFWKHYITMQTATGRVYQCQIATIVKVYLLIFSMFSPNFVTLHDIENSFQTIRFTEGAK